MFFGDFFIRISEKKKKMAFFYFGSTAPIFLPADFHKIWEFFSVFLCFFLVFIKNIEVF